MTWIRQFPTPHILETSCKTLICCILTVSLAQAQQRQSCLSDSLPSFSSPFIRSKSSCSQVQRQSKLFLFQSCIKPLCLFLSDFLLFLIISPTLCPSPSTLPHHHHHHQLSHSPLKTMSSPHGPDNEWWS